jgi:hypothetical protein
MSLVSAFACLALPALAAEPKPDAAPYAVGPYAEGDYVAFVPWEILKPYLTPEGAKIFGGVRPKGDDDGQQ